MKFTKALLAIATLVASSAYAQSTVTLYGVIDTGFVYENGGPKGSSVKLESGVSSGSRIGFKGSEDLGGGMSAIFTLEAGLLVDTGGLDQNGLLFGRQSFVGLSGGFGSVTMGRQYTPIYNALIAVDPFANNYGGAAGQLMSAEKAGTRSNNTAMYSSPQWNGVSTQLAYGFGEVPGSNTANRQVGAGIAYENGGLTLKGAYSQIQNTTATDSTKSSLLMAKYDWGFLVGSVGYGINKGTGATDSRDYIVGLSVPLGPHTLMGTVIRKDDRSASNFYDVNQFALAYTYALSKRTNLYVAGSKLSNTRFTASKFGTGDRELDIGIKHTF